MDVAFLGQQTQKFMEEARKRPEIARVSTTLLPNVPQFFLNVDQDKVLKQGVQLSDVYKAVQVFMGGSFINYFNRFGTASAFGVGLLTMRITATPIEPIKPAVLITIAGTAIIGALWAVLAAALGMLTRSTAIALVALLLWRFVLEGIIPSVITHPNLRPWLPSGTADALLFGRADLLPPLGGALIFASYAALLTLAGARTFTRWDT
jgi:hypothetical protein